MRFSLRGREQRGPAQRRRRRFADDQRTPRRTQPQERALCFRHLDDQHAGKRGSGTDSRIFEVTREDGQVVWELRLGPDIGVYRAERITPPLVRTING